MTTKHDPNKVLMGATQSSHKEITNYKGDIEAGVAARLKDDGELSRAAADGALVGISVGKDLSSTDKTSVCRKGLRVPIKLTAVFNPTIGAVVSISDTTGLAIAPGGGATAVNAVYATGRIGGAGVDGGVAEDGSNVGVALIDFPGGL